MTSDVGHQFCVEIKVVVANQASGQRLARIEKMAEIGAREVTACIAITAFVQRCFVGCVTAALYDDLAVRGKSHTGSAIPGREHTVKKVDTLGDCLDNVLGVAAAHEVAGFLFGKDLVDLVDGFVRQGWWFADHQAADAVAGKTEFHNALGALLAEVLIGCALDYGE